MSAGPSGEEDDHLGEHRQRPEHARRRGADAGGAPADDGERIVHGVAAQDQRRREHEVAESRNAQQCERAAGRRAPCPRAAARECAWRRAPPRPGEGLRPDDGLEPEGADELPGKQDAGDERGGARAAHPAVLERRHPGGAERQRIGQNRHRREECGLQQRESEERGEAVRRQVAERDRAGERDADHQHHAQRLQAIGNAPGERRRDEPDRRCPPPARSRGARAAARAR